MRNRRPENARASAPWALLGLLAVLAFVTIVRIRYLDVPLERDEGEYAYAGRLILDGIPPYSIAYNMKFPGVYYAFALIMAVFGRTVSGIHVGLLLVNAASIVMIFALGRRLGGELTGAAAAIAFAILTIDRGPFGVFAHATHFVVIAALGGFILLLRALDSRRPRTLILSGVLFGLSVLMKQHAIFYLPMAAALVVFDDGSGNAWLLRDRLKSVGWLAAGSMIPPAVVGVLLAAQGVFAKFWFWTFQYAKAYVSEVPLSEAWGSFLWNFKDIAESNWAFWLLALGGLVALWTMTVWSRRVRLVVTGMLVASFLAICPGFYFRGHYFIVLLPPVALLGAIAAESLRRVLGKSMKPAAAVASGMALIVAAVAIYVAADSHYLFQWSPRLLSRLRYGTNPFIEAVDVAKYVRERTSPTDRIAVVGSEPEIYFYADRTSATGYVYTYALMEEQPYASKMQKEMMTEIEAAHPRFLVVAWVASSWAPRPKSDQSIIQWTGRYIQQCYNSVGVMDIVSRDETTVIWGPEVRNYKPVSDSLLFTFERKSDAPCTAPK